MDDLSCKATLILEQPGCALRLSLDLPEDFIEHLCEHCGIDLPPEYVASTILRVGIVEMDKVKDGEKSPSYDLVASGKD